MTFPHEKITAARKAGLISSAEADALHALAGGQTPAERIDELSAQLERGEIDRGVFVKMLDMPSDGFAVQQPQPVMSTTFTVTPRTPEQIASDPTGAGLQAQINRVTGDIRSAHAKMVAGEWAQPIPIPGVDYEPLTPPHPTSCAHAGLWRSASNSDEIECSTCGVFFMGQTIRAIGVPPYDRERARLADEAGALRTERDELLRENATLRRKVERLEKKR